MAMEQSLFGPSAAAVQDQLLQQDAAFGNNLTPVGLATAIGGSAGRHIGNIMGMEDPRVAEAKAVQEAVQELRSSGVDMNDPAEYFKKMAGIFGAKGLTKQAEMAAAKALEYQDKKEQRGFNSEKYKLQLEQERTQLAEKNIQLQIAIQKAKGKPGASELQAILKDNFPHATVESKTAAWRVLGTDGKTLQDALDVLKSEDKENWTDTYTLDNQGRKVMAQRNTKTGELRVVDRAPVTNVAVNSTVLNKQEEGINKNKVDLANKAEVAAVDAEKTLSHLDRMEEVAQKAFVGAGSDAKQGASKFINDVFGLSISGVSESDILDKMFSELTINEAARLKGSLSDKDVLFLKQVTGSRGMTFKALMEAIQQLKDQKNRDVFAWKDIQDWQNKNPGVTLNDYDFPAGQGRAWKNVQNQKQVHKEWAGFLNQHRDIAQAFESASPELKQKMIEQFAKKRGFMQ